MTDSHYAAEDRATAGSVLPQLIARAEIHDATLRYCRGIDRFQPALVRSSHHSDGYDDYGVFRGTIDEFIEFIFPLLERSYVRTSHILHNQLIEFASNDVALVETYMTTVQVRSTDAGEQQVTAYGRYLDRFEFRDGRWGIAHRTCVTDTARTDDIPPWQGASRLSDMYHGARDESDPLHAKLGVTRATSAGAAAEP
jgi:hypothetical protein